MSQTHMVSVGGVDYDGHSGLPVEKAELALHSELKRVQSVHAGGVHRSAPQRSTALNRKFVKKDVSRPVAVKPLKKSGGGMDIRRVSRSPHISKFARDPQGIVHRRPVATDIAPTTHPVVAKAHANQATATLKTTAHHPAAHDIKQAAVSHALENAKPAEKQKKSRGRMFNVAAASLGVLLITGYFTYVNMPNLSVRVAAAQAGIDASYPEYHPIGYRLDGPVAYTNGEVSMKFASNSGPLAFTLNQSDSKWDSSALLEKYVNPRSDGKYATYSDSGLTIYTFGTDAAWVNGGILYTVDGNANLSNEQIRRIATSM